MLLVLSLFFVIVHCTNKCCLERESDSLRTCFILNGCVSFKISTHSDTSGFITHTKEKRMFLLQQVVTFLVPAC